MKEIIGKVLSNSEIATNIYKMVISADTSDITKPGQFVNIQIDGCFLRRPISVCDYTNDTLTLLYRVVGEGTEKLANYKTEEEIKFLSGLGNGFNTNNNYQHPVLVGGGIGIPPLFKLCKKLLEEGKKPTVVLGYNNRCEVFYERDFLALGVNTIVTTADGSYGIKGFVTDVLDNIVYDYFYTCGPEPMYKALHKKLKTSGQYSFESRMGCGFGACMGCSCKTITGNKRICKEGPVLESEEIIWND